MSKIWTKSSPIPYRMTSRGNVKKSIARAIPRDSSQARLWFFFFYWIPGIGSFFVFLVISLRSTIMYVSLHIHVPMYPGIHLLLYSSCSLVGYARHKVAYSKNHALATRALLLLLQLCNPYCRFAPWPNPDLIPRGPGPSKLDTCLWFSRQQVCVFFTFYPSTSSTTSVRADSSILEEIQVMWSQSYATEIR